MVVYEHLTGEGRKRRAPNSHTEREIAPSALAREWQAFAENLKEKFGGPNGFRTRVYYPPRARLFRIRQLALLCHEN